MLDLFYVMLDSRTWHFCNEWFSRWSFVWREDALRSLFSRLDQWNIHILKKKTTKVLLHLPRAKRIVPVTSYDVTTSFMWRHGVTDVMSQRHIMSWHHTISRFFLSDHSNKKTVDMMFFDQVTSTFDLDCWTRPRYYQGRSLYQISWPYAKRFSCESANWQTHRQTHRRLRFYNLDR